MNWPATRSLPLRLLHPRVIALTALVIGGNAWRTAHTAANTSDDNVTEHSELSRSVAELRDAVHELERETEMMNGNIMTERTRAAVR